jgi:hypothetical protein
VATANEKRIKARLERIKERASEMNLQSSKSDAGAELAEEAAGLGLQLLEGRK